MKKQKRYKPIAATVAGKICLILIFMCICLSVGIRNAFYRELSLAESQYMTEVISRISAEVNSELNHYIDTTIITARSNIIQDYLVHAQNGTLTQHILSEELSDDASAQSDSLLAQNTEYTNETELLTEGEPDITVETDTPPSLDVTIPPDTSSTLEANDLSYFQQVLEYDNMLDEINGIEKYLGDSVLYVVVCSIAQDNFVNSAGLEGDSDYSLVNRPFYEAYTSKQTYITDPYEELLTGLTIITIAEPVFDTNGEVIGIVLVQLSLDKLSNIVTSATFGQTGASMLMDRNNNIIAYNNSAVVGMNVSQLNYSGDIAVQELANPTGQIAEYSFGDDKRTGGIARISDLSGWKILLAMNSTEFKGNISIVSLRLNSALIVAIIICSGLCARIVFTSLSPMKKLEEFMEDLAKGNLTSRAVYDEPNEIGRLAAHMNQTADSLSLYITMIDTALTSLGQGDLRRPQNMNFKGDFKKLEHSLARFSITLSQSLREIKLSMNQMNQGSVAVADGAQLLAYGSSEQNNSVEGLQNLIKNINETIVVTAKNSSTVTKDARQISEHLVESNDKMHELVISVQDIRTMSDEVKRIIKSIEDVAFQTNILSLNASVEAARAGTAGRGFAVVADQVRILSISTAEAAEQTTAIINEIAKAIELNTELAQTTSNELQGVVDDVNVFVQNISSISLSAQDQADAIAEINRGIDEISKVVVQNSAISEESAASSEQLSSKADLMLELVSQYKLVDN